MKKIVMTGVIALLAISTVIGVRIYRTHAIFLDHIAQGDQEYRNGEYQKALASYQHAYQLKSVPEAYERIDLAKQGIEYQQLKKQSESIQRDETARKKTAVSHETSQPIVRKTTERSGERRQQSGEGKEVQAETTTATNLIITFRGLYEQENRLLGLRFLDDTRVNMLAKGKKIGETVTYKIQGNTLIIKHACGTWYLEIQKDKLFHKEFKSYFVKR